MNNDHHNSNTPHNALIERVLGRIDAEHVAPRPRWRFTLENGIFWTLGALAVALGALAAAAALFEFANAGWRFYAATHPDLPTFLLAVAPFLWLLALGLFILIGYENIRRTKRGYRYPLAVIVLGAVLTSITLGAALFAAGLGQEIEEAVGDHPPFYRPLILAEHRWWINPAAGLIAGEVEGVSTSSDSFLLRGFDGTLWTVAAEDLGTSSIATVERGGEVRVIGVPDPLATSSLYGCYVFHWETYGALEAPAMPTPFPPPMDERTAGMERSEICKGVSPYGSFGRARTLP